VRRGAVPGRNSGRLVNEWREFRLNIMGLNFHAPRMRGFWIVFAALFLAGGLLAQEVTIRNVGRGHAVGWVFVDNGWVRNGDLMDVKFNVKSEMPSKGFKMQWGFFDAEKKLLGKFSGLPRVQTRGTDYQTLPETLRPNQSYTVSFPVPPSMNSGAGRWRTFAIEMGAEPARAMYPPGGAVADFPLDAPADKPALAAGDVQPTIKRITRYRNGLPAWVDKGWVSGLNTLRVTVQVDSGAEAHDFYARVHFFNAEKKEIFAWANPPQVSVRTWGTYVSLPAIWKNGESCDLHFPIPQKIDQGAGSWRTAVVIFGDAKAVVAEAYPATSKVADFDFPEKGRLPAK
jgi:hypothetical protein